MKNNFGRETTERAITQWRPHEPSNVFLDVWAHDSTLRLSIPTFVQVSHSNMWTRSIDQLAIEDSYSVSLSIYPDQCELTLCFYPDAIHGPILSRYLPETCIPTRKYPGLVMNPAQPAIEVEEECVFCYPSLRKFHEFVKHVLKSDMSRKEGVNPISV